MVPVVVVLSSSNATYMLLVVADCALRCLVSQACDRQAWRGERVPPPKPTRKRARVGGNDHEPGGSKDAEVRLHFELLVSFKQKSGGYRNLFQATCLIMISKRVGCETA